MIKLMFNSLFLGFCFLTTSTFFAQDNRIQIGSYQDVNEESIGSQPRQFMLLGEKLFFAATNYEYGHEIWYTDGTTSGTKLLKDIFPGESPSSSSPKIVFNNKLYFSANDGEDPNDPNPELWVTDGTSEGTQRLRDQLGKRVVSPGQFMATENLIYFTAYDPELGFELWVSEGSESGTKFIKDIVPGSRDGNIRSMTPFGNQMIFFANDNIGTGMWVSDGTTEGTIRITPNNGYASGNEVLAIDDQLFFAGSGINRLGIEVWVSDGTMEGTTLTKDIYENGQTSNPREFTAFDGQLFFVADESFNSSDLWKSDGTTEGTIKMADFSPSGQSGIEKLTVINNKLYFKAWSQLYVLENSNAEPISLGIQLLDMVQAGDDLFYRTSSNELWVYHTLSEQTEKLQELEGFTSLLFNQNERFYFLNRVGVQARLWTSDGTPTGTQFIRSMTHPDAQSVTNLDAFLKRMAPLGEKLILSPEDKDTGEEPWLYDPSTRNTTLLKKINEATLGAKIDKLVALNDKLVFYANQVGGITTKFQPGIWVTDGTSEGTQLLKNEFTRVMGSAFNKAFYVTSNFDSEYIWATDGTVDGDVLLTEIKAGVQKFISIGSLMFFFNFDELWVSDGTPDGTKFIKAINFTTPQFNHQSLNFGNRLFFYGDDGISGRELWVSDGTEEGTYMVYDVNGTSESSEPKFLTTALGRIFFTARSSNTSISEIWMTDGSATNTRKIGDTESLFNGGEIKDLTGVGELIYFTHNQSLYHLNAITEEITLVGPRLKPSGLFESNGKLFFNSNATFEQRLWVSEGTEESTLPLGRSQNIDGGRFYRFGNSFFFTSRNQKEGMELWTSNGTEEGTFIVNDLYPGRKGSFPKLFVEKNGRAYFVAVSPKYGQSLFYLDYANPPSFKGKVFHDINQNGIQEADEPGLPNVLVKAMPYNQFVFTSEDGQYEIQGKEGDFEISPSPNLCWEITTGPSQVSFRYNGQIQSEGPSFGLVETTKIDSLALSVTAAPFRCGFNVPIWLVLRNTGCSPISGQLELDLGGLTQYVSSDMTPLKQEENLITWNIPELTAGKVERIRLEVKVANEEFSGEKVSLELKMINELGALVNHEVFYGEIRCAFDPNDKLVAPSRDEETKSNYTQFDELLEYTIRFQNTGNDTAIHVMITDQLSGKLNWSSFRPGGSSHPYHVSINQENGLVTFYFRNILLPDTIVNEPQSHGFVNYTILASPDIEEQETVLNSADIFFDFNKPVLTKEVKNTFVEFLDFDQDGTLFYEDCQDEDPLINPNAEDIPGNGIDEDCDGMDNLLVSIQESILASQIQVFPNPAINEVFIQNDRDAKFSLYIYNALGDKLDQHIISGSSCRIPTVNWAPGTVILQFLDMETGLSIIKKLIVLKQ